jgi:hypothetical protein
LKSYPTNDQLTIEICQKFVKHIFPQMSSEDALFGVTKIYLRQHFEMQWEAAKRAIIRARHDAAVTIISANFRGYLQRCKWRRKLEGREMF